jgi:hypothetical protein
MKAGLQRAESAVQPLVGNEHRWARAVRVSLLRSIQRLPVVSRWPRSEVNGSGHGFTSRANDIKAHQEIVEFLTSQLLA